MVRVAVALTCIGLLAELAGFSLFVAVVCARLGEWTLASAYGVETVLSGGLLVRALRSRVGDLVVGPRREARRG